MCVCERECLCGYMNEWCVSAGECIVRKIIIIIPRRSKKIMSRQLLKIFKDCQRFFLIKFRKLFYFLRQFNVVFWYFEKKFFKNFKYLSAHNIPVLFRIYFHSVGRLVSTYVFILYIVYRKLVFNCNNFICKKRTGVHYHRKIWKKFFNH